MMLASRIMFRLFAVLALTLAFSRSGMAVDVVTARVPSPVPDADLRIGGRVLHLPPGDWHLVQRLAHEVHSSGHHRDVDAYDAWVVSMDGRRLRGIVRFSAPIADAPQIGGSHGNPCVLSDSGILRNDLSRGKSGAECLAVFGHYSMQKVLNERAPEVQDWLADRRAVAVDAIVQIVFLRRMSGSFARVDVYLPVEVFPSDNDATAWADTLRDSLEAFFDEKLDEGRLPDLPALPDPGAVAPRP